MSFLSVHTYTDKIKLTFYHFNRLGQTCVTSKKNKSSTEDDIDKHDCDDLEIFADKIETHRHQLEHDDQGSNSSKNSNSNFHLQTTRIQTNRSAVETSQIEEEEFFNPNRMSAKITVDVTVEFERENIYTAKIDEV